MVYVSEKSHLIYLHMDPGTRELLYVGTSRGMVRALDFRARSAEHQIRLRGLLEHGWKREQIARSVASDLTPETARFLEKQVIRFMRPTFNQQNNPNVTPFASIGSAVA